MASRRAERGQARKSFVINSALLSLIDPVRGEPTKDLLERYANDDVLRSQQLKEKFLDSFALICSTSSLGRETASAVCMEQNQEHGTVIRMARNRGLSIPDRIKLNKVLQILINAANGERLSMQAEIETLEVVVELDKDRILALIEKLDRGGIRRVFQIALSRLSARDCDEELWGEPDFARWMNSCPFAAPSLVTPGKIQLFAYVKWAAEARWVYHTHLQSLLAADSTPSPAWIETLYKLARYWAAIKSMVKFAVKEPEIFTKVCIKAVEAPAQQSFSISHEKTTLRTTLKRLVKNDSETIMNKLAQRWDTDDVEAKLRKACRLSLTLHAEMQLLAFYERNPDLVPHLRLMGTSKKACYLCHEYLLRHPLRIRALACHQKIYPSWLPPHCDSIRGSPDNKLFWNLNKHIEQVAVRELRTGLAAPRRPRNLDSTAGPSLTVTATVPTEVWIRHTTSHHLAFEDNGFSSKW